RGAARPPRARGRCGGSGRVAITVDARSMSRLFCFGLGYSASVLARQLRGEGWHVGGTARTTAGAEAIAAKGFAACVFDGTTPSPDAATAVAEATHVLVSLPAEADGDPVLRHHIEDLAKASSLAWV